MRQRSNCQTFYFNCRYLTYNFKGLLHSKYLSYMFFLLVLPLNNHLHKLYLTRVFICRGLPFFCDCMKWKVPVYAYQNSFWCLIVRNYCCNLHTAFWKCSLDCLLFIIQEGHIIVCVCTTFQSKWRYFRFDWLKGIGWKPKRYIIDLYLPTSEVYCISNCHGTLSKHKALWSCTLHPQFHHCRSDC